MIWFRSASGMVTVATANDAASKAKAGPVFSVATTTPAIAGPMRPESCIMICTRAFAGDSSRSLTSIGTMVFSAGWKNASTVPKMSART